MIRSRLSLALLLGVAATFSPGYVGLDAATSPPKTTVPSPSAKASPPPQPFVVPKAEFMDDIKQGKDPFFPASRRRNPAPPSIPNPAPNSPNANPMTIQPTFASLLSLKGISITAKGKRFATINSYTFARGESYVVRTTNGTNRVRCIDIRDSFVTIQIEGVSEPKNLYLQSD